MKNLLFLTFLICFLSAFSQKYSTIDIVKVNAIYEKEAMYFYEKNWKAFRVVAKKNKVISAYHLLRSSTDSTNHFDLTLITTYKNEAAHGVAEEKFRPIMNKINPNGPQYLNDIKREKFVKFVASSEGLEVIFN